MRGGGDERGRERVRRVTKGRERDEGWNRGGWRCGKGQGGAKKGGGGKNREGTIFFFKQKTAYEI